MNHNFKMKHSKSEVPVVKMSELNSYTEAKINNFIPSSVAPDNNRLHNGRSNPLGSKGN